MNKLQEERIKALVAELVAEEYAQGWEPRTIDDIEDQMVRIGDLVAREVGVRMLAEQTSRPCMELCPTCGNPGEHLGDRDRELITSRGAVPLTEAKCRCPKCRRLFFPSDGTVGD